MDVWQRLIDLHYCVIGLGRTGSGVAQALVRSGVRRLTLVDHDKVELATMRESLTSLSDADIGRFKVEAVADSLAKTAGWSSEISPVPASITRLHALQAAQACDIMIVTADHDGARLAATIIALLFSKPLVDIGSGIHGQGHQRRMGADIRLVLPGNCLRCFGGLATTHRQDKSWPLRTPKRLSTPVANGSASAQARLRR